MDKMDEKESLKRLLDDRGLKEEIKNGTEDQKIRTALMLKEIGLSLDGIAEVTGLPVAVIEQLK